MMSVMEHGYVRYKKRGCRCSTCVEDMRAKNRAYKRAFRKRNPTRRHEEYVANKLAHQEWARAYYEANREHMLAKAKEWRESEAGKRSTAMRNARRRAARRGAPGDATRSQIEARWAYYGRRCWMCGTPATETDHVIPLSRGGTNWPANLRPACRSCNAHKHAKVPA